MCIKTVRLRSVSFVNKLNLFAFALSGLWISHHDADWFNLNLNGHGLSDLRKR